MSDHQCPALLVSAPASGQGKTSVTAGLARLFSRQNLKVRCFKTGPDFIDPMILERASGHPVYQLDLWMVGENDCRQLLSDAAKEADLILVEGVMGLFDGTPSSADIAELFGLQVLAVINAAAMAQTFAALAHGLATFRPSLNVTHVLANRVGSEHHANLVQQGLSEELTLGYLPRNEAFELPERHLGLCLAQELPQLDSILDALADKLQETPFAQLPPALEFKFENPKIFSKGLEGQRIAIAKDEAFAFLYPANIQLLEKLGAQIIYFSPLTDKSLPEADALYLPGGYPELHAATLSKNSSLIADVKTFIKDDKPVMAECGGMIFLSELLKDKNDQQWPMAGALPFKISMNKRLSGLGMQFIETPFGELKGHTFHYSSLETDMNPIQQASNPNGRNGEQIFCHGKLTASYVHWYLPSNPELTVKLFTEGLETVYG